LAEDCGAADAEDDRLGVAEDRGDLVAAGALDVHEVAGNLSGVRAWMEWIHRLPVGMLDEPLQLVLALLFLGARVEQVLGKL